MSESEVQERPGIPGVAHEDVLVQQVERPAAHGDIVRGARPGIGAVGRDQRVDEHPLAGSGEPGGLHDHGRPHAVRREHDGLGLDLEGSRPPRAANACGPAAISQHLLHPHVGPQAAAAAGHLLDVVARAPLGTAGAPSVALHAEVAFVRIDELGERSPVETLGPRRPPDPFSPLSDEALGQRGQPELIRGLRHVRGQVDAVALLQHGMWGSCRTAERDRATAHSQEAPERSTLHRDGMGGKGVVAVDYPIEGGVACPTVCGWRPALRRGRPVLCGPAHALPWLRPARSRPPPSRP